jgi:hypothetical protein
MPSQALAAHCDFIAHEFVAKPERIQPVATDGAIVQRMSRRSGSRFADKDMRQRCSPITAPRSTALNSSCRASSASMEPACSIRSPMSITAIPAFLSAATDLIFLVPSTDADGGISALMSVTGRSERLIDTIHRAPTERPARSQISKKERHFSSLAHDIPQPADCKPARRGNRDAIRRLLSPRSRCLSHPVFFGFPTVHSGPGGVINEHIGSTTRGCHEVVLNA